MSCGNPAVEGEEALMQGRPNFDKSNSCIKCKVERGNLVIRHAVYCKNCFFPLVTTKFRRCLEPHINETSETSRRTALKASGNLLVGFSGGLGSTVLLDILSSTYFPSSANGSINGKGGKAHPRNKKVWTRAYACYVEVCGAFPEGQMRDRSGDVRTFFEKNNRFDYVSARLEDAFDPSWWAKFGGQTSAHTLNTNLGSEDLPLFFETLPTNQTPESPISLLRTFLTSLPTPTAVQSAIASLLRLILIHVAHHLQCSHLALGTSLTSLSISLISAIAQGDGFHIREESFEEWRDPLNMANAGDQPKTIPVRLVRPLRDVGMKECAAWMYWKGLSIVGREKLPGITVKQTIGSLTKSFIIGLERDYPSTVSTIARTCGKLAPKDEAHHRCVLCERPTPSGVLDWKARISVRSRFKGDNTISPSPASEESRTESHSQSDRAFLSPHLCYACHTLLTSKSPRSTVSHDAPVYLPQWTIARLNPELLADPCIEKEEIWSASVMTEGRMKAVIDDFLLET